MIENFYILFVSIFFSAAIICTRKFHLHITADHIIGPQKLHNDAVPRIGGLAIFASLSFFQLTFTEDNAHNLILFSLMPAFLIGFIEDLTNKIYPFIRIIFLTSSAIISINITGVLIESINIPVVDLLFLNYFFCYIFTAFCLIGIANAFNIIDGLNGLSSSAACISIIGIILISLQCSDYFIINLCLPFLFAIVGFTIFNFPLGKIFLGDGGSYFIGMACGLLAIMLLNRNPDVSPWAILLLLMYPFSETILTMARRFFVNKTSLSHADNLHLHTLVYKKIIISKFKFEAGNLSNSLASILLLILSLIPMLVGSFFFRDNLLLSLFTIAYLLSYIYIYIKISKI